MPVLNTMIQVATQTENLQAAVKAGADILTRASIIGAVDRAKIRSSRKGDGSQGKIIVNIGFLQRQDGTPTTVEVATPKAGNGEA